MIWRMNAAELKTGMLIGTVAALAMSGLASDSGITVRSATKNGVEVRWFEEMVPMKDGTRLYTYGTVPPDGETRGIVFKRTPYAKECRVKMEDYAYGKREALSRGYAYVEQHVRGTGMSEGDWIPYASEREDGLAMLEWLRRLPYYNGEIFLSGGSYLSSVHFSYLDTNPPDVKGAALSVQDVNRYNVAYRNGIFKIGLHGNWFVKGYRKKDRSLQRNASASFTDFPLEGFSRRCWGAAVPALDNVLSHPRPDDPFWRSHELGSGVDYLDAIGKSTMPVLLRTAFYDIYTDGVCEMWRGMTPERRANCALIIDAYDHGGRLAGWAKGTRGEFPGGSRVDSGVTELDWFDYCRTGKPVEGAKPGRTRHYVLWENVWKETPELVDGGRRMRLALGQGARTWTYDPRRPLPQFPGSGGICFGGMNLQPPPDFRDDVVSFILPPIQERIDVRGRMAAELAVSSDREDTCFYVRVSVRKDDGNWYLLRDDITSLSFAGGPYTSGTERKVSFRFADHAFMLEKGDVLRVDVSSANSQFAPHPNVAGDAFACAEPKVARNTVFPERSFLVLPAENASVRRIFQKERPLRGNENVQKVQSIDGATWIWADAPAEWADPCVGRRGSKNRDALAPHFYRLKARFEASNEPLRFDVSADERFILYIDGREIARGPHRGMPERWFYQSYEVSLAPGPHLMEVVAWQIGAHAPLAQLSWRGGFILKAEGGYDSRLTTGKADWRIAELHNTSMTGQGESRAWGVGSECRVLGTAFCDERPDDSAYSKAVMVREPIGGNACGLRSRGWMLFPTAIPDQMHVRRTPGAFKAARGADAAAFCAADADDPHVASLNGLLRDGKGVTVPPGTSFRAIWDLGDYYCAYPELTVSGGEGAEVRWKWTESLLDANGRKGDRAAFDGKTVSKPFGDVFLSDGRESAVFTSPWWRCGRWCQIEVTTRDRPLEIRSIALWETRYPAEPEAAFECDDPTVKDIRRICTRALQMCSHEMFFDCPYYEQQMYPGDSRIQYLATGTLHSDARLVRQSITLYSDAQRPNGFIPMNFPSRMTQESVTYTMCWIDMIRDYMMWRGKDDEKWLRTRLPGMRRALDGIAEHVTEEGLIGKMPGWSFTDYTPPWRNGLPPYGKKDGLSAIESLQYLYALRSAVETESLMGERHFAAHYGEKADALAAKIRERFWCEARGMVADTSDFDSFSEQAQAFAILSGALLPGQREAAFKGLVEATDLVPATVYFSHYVFDAYFAFGRSDLFCRKLDLWRRYVKLNMSTLQETPETPLRDPRSDCHAWGAHPLYHMQAHVAGVMPSAPFFGAVRVAPQPGPLKWLKATTPTPAGPVLEDLRFAGGAVAGVVELPDGLAGTFVWNGEERPLHSGRNEL